MNDIIWSTAAELAAKYRTGDVSPVEAVEASLQRIAEVDGIVNTMVTVTADLARAQALEAEAALRRGAEQSPLFGIPITVKDLVDTSGVRTTYGSAQFADHVPDTDALAWQRLKAAGVILIGKSTTPEFGLLGVTESKLTGSTSTPWAKGYSSGGSSGGAAAGVAAGIVPLAWGSDGGGSIRVPASLCGVVGIKPSVGRIPHANNTDADGTEGPIGRSVLDTAVMLDATAGRHIRDRFSVPSPGEVFADAARRDGDLRGWRIAATTNPQHGPVDPHVLAGFDSALVTLRDLGAVVETVSIDLPDPHEFFVAYWGTEFAAAAAEMAAGGFEAWPSLVGLAEQARGLEPERVSDAFRGQKTRIYNAYVDVFEKFDLVVTPTTPIPSFPHNGDIGGLNVIDGRPVGHPGTYLHRLTEPPTHAGLPAISVPCGFTPLGLPLGLQVIAPLYEDSRAIYAAARYEQATTWHLARPPIAGTAGDQTPSTPRSRWT